MRTCWIASVETSCTPAILQDPPPGGFAVTLVKIDEDLVPRSVVMLDVESLPRPAAHDLAQAVAGRPGLSFKRCKAIKTLIIKLYSQYLFPRSRAS